MWPSSDRDADERGGGDGTDRRARATHDRRRVLAAVGATLLAGCNTASEAGDRPGTDSGLATAGSTPTRGEATPGSDTPTGTPTGEGTTEASTGGLNGTPNSPNETALPDLDEAPPSVTDDTVYAGTRKISDPKLVRDTPGTLFALDRETGGVRWDRDAVLTSATTVHDGRVYLSTTPNPPQRGLVRALDAATGGEQWRVTTPGGIKHGPVLADGRLYVGDTTGRVSAVSTAGERVWETRIGEEGIDAAPALTSDGEAVCASSVGTLACLETGSGEPRWELDVTDTRRSGLTVAGDHLYVGGVQFLVVNVETGDVVAEIPIDGGVGAYGQPVVCDDTIYVSSCVKRGKRYVYDNYLYVMG